MKNVATLCAAVLICLPTAIVAQSPSASTYMDKAKTEFIIALTLGATLERRIAIANDSCRESIVAQRDVGDESVRPGDTGPSVTLGTRIDNCQKRSLARGTAIATFRLGQVTIESVGETGCKFTCRDGTYCITTSSQSLDQVRPTQTQEATWTHTYDHPLLANYCRRLMNAYTALTLTGPHNENVSAVHTKSQSGTKSSTVDRRAAPQQAAQSMR